MKASRDTNEWEIGFEDVESVGARQPSFNDILLVTPVWTPVLQSYPILLCLVPDSKLDPPPLEKDTSVSVPTAINIPQLVYGDLADAAPSDDWEVDTDDVESVSNALLDRLGPRINPLRLRILQCWILQCRFLILLCRARNIRHS